MIERGAWMKLYGYWRSSSTWRVRIGLEVKGISYETVPVHLLKGEQRSDDYRDRNPMQQVPLLELETEGAVRRLSQSLAILEYLDEAHPAPPLLPRDPWTRARVRELAELINSGIQPLQNTGVLQHLGKLAPQVEHAVWASHFITRGLTALEALAGDRAGRFLVGDQLTLADVCLVPQLFMARRFGVSVEPFATLRRVEEACLGLPAFERTHPTRQPDAELPPQS
jgi:maleylpyruvate isomerase